MVQHSYLLCSNWQAYLQARTIRFVDQLLALLYISFNMPSLSSSNIYLAFIYTTCISSKLKRLLNVATGGYDVLFRYLFSWTHLLWLLQNQCSALIVFIAFVAAVTCCKRITSGTRFMAIYSRWLRANSGQWSSC